MSQVGPGTLTEIASALAEHGLTLAADAAPEPVPTLVDRHRALLVQYERLLALLDRIRRSRRGPTVFGPQLGV